VAERLSRLTGNPVTPVVPREAAEVLSKAA
jgi:hypothetical protein